MMVLYIAVLLAALSSGSVEDVLGLLEVVLTVSGIMLLVYGIRAAARS